MQNQHHDYLLLLMLAKNSWVFLSKQHTRLKFIGQSADQSNEGFWICIEICEIHYKQHAISQDKTDKVIESESTRFNEMPKEVYR